MTLIAIIEDEPDIVDLLSYTLRREGFDVMSAATGEAGLQLVHKQKPDLVLLDLMLPHRNGLDVCQEIRQHAGTRHIPVIIVSAKSEESDIVLGLGMQADDYITKPFSPRELVARVKAALRRHGEVQPEWSDYIEFDDLVLDAARHKVVFRGHDIRLTATEFKLLQYMASHPGRVFTREHLLNQIVGDHVVVIDRNIDVHVRAIRKKMDDVEYIETIRGVGYRFREAKPG